MELLWVPAEDVAVGSSAVLSVAAGPAELAAVALHEVASETGF